MLSAGDALGAIRHAVKLAEQAADAGDLNPADAAAASALLLLAANKAREATRRLDRLTRKA